jgi:hypothetical protein
MLSHLGFCKRVGEMNLRNSLPYESVHPVQIRIKFVKRIIYIHSLLLFLLREIWRSQHNLIHIQIRKEHINKLLVIRRRLNWTIKDGERDTKIERKR